MRFLALSDSSVLATAGDRISEPVNAEVIDLFRRIEAASPVWLENLHPAYASLLIDFNPQLASHGDVVDFVQKLPPATAIGHTSKMVELEVRYDGCDVGEVALYHGLSRENVIRFHAAQEYRVAFLGFIPGFAYLLGLPREIATPRLATPRRCVAAGSVAIGGKQTGVYPADSPGGWRILGRVLNRELPLPADWVAPGDRVRFLPV